MWLHLHLLTGLRERFQLNNLIKYSVQLDDLSSMKQERNVMMHKTKILVDWFIRGSFGSSLMNTLFTVFRDVCCLRFSDLLKMELAKNISMLDLAILIHVICKTFSATIRVPLHLSLSPCLLFKGAQEQLRRLWHFLVAFEFSIHLFSRSKLSCSAGSFSP